MTDTVIATRAIVTIGPLLVDKFMLPDGFYRMSQIDTAKAIGLGRQSLSDFLHSKAINRLLRESFTGQKDGTQRDNKNSESASESRAY